jgi:repressor LexA
MELHPVQEKIVAYLRSKKGNIEDLSLRDIGEQIGVGKKPQIIAHHLKQLELKGYLVKSDSDKKVYQVLKSPISEVVYINVYESAECGPEGLLGSDTIVDRVPLSSRTFGISNPKDFFLIKARGKSMEPMIKDGDLVLARYQADIDNGSIGVVVHNGMPKIKKVIKTNTTKNNVFFSLVSLNPDYKSEDIMDGDDDLKVAGLVKSIIRFPKN